jgi:hypothetical protein
MAQSGGVVHRTSARPQTRGRPIYAPADGPPITARRVYALV